MLKNVTSKESRGRHCENVVTCDTRTEDGEFSAQGDGQNLLSVEGKSEPETRN